MVIKITVCFSLLLLWTCNAVAQSPFYEGKTIRIMVGYPAGTTHDTWARLAAQYMGKYIAGNPNFVASKDRRRLVVAAKCERVAKPDGLTQSTFHAALDFKQLTDARKFNSSGRR